MLINSLSVRCPLLVGLLLSSCAPDASEAAAAAPGAGHDEAFLRGFKTLKPDEGKHHDPITVIAVDSHISFRQRWHEHPEGGYLRATNDRGFNEDEDTPLEKRGLRILVAGDSHTEGVVSNHESFANVLERLLRENGRPLADVLNAGVGYTGPHCYLGVLQKNLDLAPDVFVATLFAGNDFLDDLRVHYLLEGTQPPVGDERYLAPLRALQRKNPPACWQGANQTYRFAHHPEEREIALAAVEASCAAMQELCAARGILMLAVVLPTKYDVDLDDRATQFGGVEELGLTPEELDDNARLGAEIVRRLERRGIPCLDPLPTFRDEPAPLYWRTDHHLNVAGHAKLGELLFAKLTAELEPAR